MKNIVNIFYHLKLKYYTIKYLSDRTFFPISAQTVFWGVVEGSQTCVQVQKQRESNRKEKQNGAAWDETMAKTISDKCTRCGKPVSDVSKAYHATKLWCGTCRIYFCTGCAPRKRYCPQCGKDCH
jgi:hypothetical protein